MRDFSKRCAPGIAMAVLLVCAPVVYAQPLIPTSFFTYQGELKFDGEPYDGIVDLTFRLFDQAMDGNQVGSTVPRNNVSVNGGLFQVTLSFGAPDVWRSQARWIEIEANGQVLGPRQRVRPAPQAWMSRHGFTNGGNWSVVDSSGNKRFEVTDDGEVHIDADTGGDVHIRTPDSVIHFHPGIRVEVHGHLVLPDSGILRAGYVRTDRIDMENLPFGQGDAVCRQSSSPNIGFLRRCGSSRRLKDGINTLQESSKLLAALRPVRFTWKGGGRADIGLIAEEVAEVIPELATYDDDGEIGGVNYRHLTAVLIAGWQEQQAEMAAQQAEMAAQQAEIVALRAELEAERRQTAERLAALEALLLDGSALAQMDH